MKRFASLFCCLYFQLVWGQRMDSSIQSISNDTTLQDSKRGITWNGYAELYYNQNSSGPLAGNGARFAYNHDISKKAAVNLVFIKASLAKEKFRANLALAAGSYMQANYAGERGIYQQILEANLGWKLNARNNWWLDVGVFNSHIGFESAIGKDCWTLTRSLAADNSPYFETGIKTTFISANNQWLISGLVLTGWQTIQIPSGTNHPSFGHQIQFRPNSKWLLNSSSFIGQGRFFHNFYAQYQLKEQLSLIGGLDIGVQKVAGLTFSKTWYTPVIMVQYIHNEKLKLAIRAEAFSDRNGILIFTGTPNHFMVSGGSVNVDYRIAKPLLWRVELKQLSSRDAVFTDVNRMPSTNLFSAITALVFSF